MSESMFSSYPESGNQFTYETDPEILRLLLRLADLKSGLSGVKPKAEGSGWQSISDGEKSRITTKILGINREIDSICAQKSYKRSSEFDREHTQPNNDLGIRRQEF